MKSTKELARQLGLLRRRSTTSNQQSRDARRVKKTNQIFSYLIVIDFESTCWKDKKNVSQEVIEFPAVLLNTSTGSIEAEFHTYVLPEENPQLSAFCTELTGITQDQVESGVPLRFCLSKFSRWLTKQENEKSIAYNSGDEGKKLCTFVTWSDWDLSVCLHYECRRKQLLKPSALNSWIDLRATYKNFYERKPNGLHGALQDVGIEFRGRQHSGLDDARNTAHLAWRMMCDGCLMKITRTMPGTQQLKRKQTAQLPEQPTKVQVKQNTGKERQEPDSLCVNTHRGIESEDRLISHTQGICDEFSQSGKIRNTSLSSSIHFKIWEDATQPATVHSVIRPETSLPSLKDNEIGLNSSKNEGTEFFPVQTSLGAKIQSENRGMNKGKTHDAKLQSLNKGKQALFVRNTFNSRSSNCNGNICGNKDACSKSDVGENALQHTASHNLVNKIPTRVKSLVNTTTNAVPTRKNNKQFAGSARTGLQSTVTSPASLHGSSTSPPTPVVFKTPLSTPLHKQSVKPSPSDGFKTPYAPRTCTTPGSGSFKTPTQPSNTCTTPSLMGGKITPPMCQCGRRAKRRTAQSPGPNVNRVFYSCASGRRSSEAGLKDVTNSKKGCGYFKWESMVLAEKQRLVATSPVNQVSPWSAQRQSAVTSTSQLKKSAAKFSTSKTVTPVGFTGKRLGIAMRAVLRQQNQV
ncbi:ERI1 exoribonuclease 2-like [Patiria miniata]|uniref:ERI1 exoribonuclease 2 n=1 Tax=Patiria miniata TaxID=46514 RepID=A0A914AY92_PATMI|nr:ERI1 exoribonuclease 2-like [Patiria miniata]